MRPTTGANFDSITGALSSAQAIPLYCDFAIGTICAEKEKPSLGEGFSCESRLDFQNFIHGICK
jgi:hypothetical protein